MKIISKLRLALLGLTLIPLVIPAARARPWKPQGTALAQDYAVITDGRSKDDIVVLFWLVPQLVPDSPEAMALLDKYVILGAVHGHLVTGGTVNFDTDVTLQPSDADGKPLTLLEGDKVPPTAAGVVTIATGMMRQALGAMGQGMHFFAFEGNVHACAKGGMSVTFAGETYTYATPIPGCPAKP